MIQQDNNGVHGGNGIMPGTESRGVHGGNGIAPNTGSFGQQGTHTANGASGKPVITINIGDIKLSVFAND